MTEPLLTLEPDDEPEGSGELVEEGAPTWVVTFGDMMSLLLTFFILMYSMSELEMDRFLLASNSLSQAMGGTAEEKIDEPMGLMPDPVDPDLNMQKAGPADYQAVPMGPETGVDATVDVFVAAYLAMLERRLKELVKEAGMEGSVFVERDGDGVWLRLGTAALFRSGEAKLVPEGSVLLDRVAAFTGTLELGVTVSGHTDDVPINLPHFPSNWELSGARAAGVARRLLAAGYRPDRLRVEAWGEHKPLASNDTRDGRARNRRVDLLFSRNDVVAAAERLAAAEMEDVAAEAEAAVGAAGSDAPPGDGAREAPDGEAADSPAAGAATSGAGA